MKRTPPLLTKMLEIPVGEIVVRGSSIVEPKSGCVIARGFPSKASAVKAASEMNEVADWLGIIKTRAADGLPNCQDELARIAVAHGGSLGTGGGQISAAHCARIVAKTEGRP